MPRTYGNFGLTYICDMCGEDFTSQFWSVRMTRSPRSASEPAQTLKETLCHSCITRIINFMENKGELQHEKNSHA